MSVITFCNVGTRDVSVGKPESLPPRSLGRQYLDNLESLRSNFQFPTIETVLQEVLDTTGGHIDHLVFIGTDQQSEQFRQRDTLYFAQVLAAVIPDRFPDKIGAVHVESVGQDGDPSLYDEAWDEFSHILSPYAADAKAICAVLPTGGIPACNTALILQGVHLFGERCHIFYQSESGKAIPLDIGAQVLRVLQHNALIEALGRFDFTTACNIYKKSGRPDPLVQKLLDYASSRLRFDFEGAYGHLNDALMTSKGGTRQRLQAIREELKHLLEGDELARMGELYHNARIAWNNGRYLDFLARLIRFHTAVLYHKVQVLYDDSAEEFDQLAFKSLAIRPDLRRLLLQTLKFYARQMQPHTDLSEDQALMHELKDRLEAHFSLGELNDLSFDLGIDFENISGTDKNSKIISLITYLSRRGRIEELITVAAIRRPKIDWFQRPSEEDKNQLIITDALHRIDSLVTLRNESIIGHGYRGVSRQIILETYHQSLADEDCNPVEDMAAICTALGIPIANPFREICNIIQEALASPHA